MYNYLEGHNGRNGASFLTWNELAPYLYSLLQVDVCMSCHTGFRKFLTAFFIHIYAY